MKQNSYRQDSLLSRYDSITSTFVRDPDDPRDFAIGSLRVLTFDRASKVYHEPRNIAEFDERSDLLLFQRQLGIAVAIQFFNLNAIESKPKVVRPEIRVVLVDETANQEIDSEIVRECITGKRREKPVRIDFSLPYLMAQPTHDYCVKVMSLATRRVICSRRVRLFDVPVMCKGPMSWFEVANVELECTPDKDCRGTVDQYDLNVTFNLSSDLRPITARLPELSVDLYLPDGREFRQYLIPQPVPGYENRFTLRFEERIEQLPQDGYIYAQICAMGYKFSGFILPASKLKGVNLIDPDWLITIETPKDACELENTYRRIKRRINASLVETSESEWEGFDDLYEQQHPNYDRLWNIIQSKEAITWPDRDADDEQPHTEDDEALAASKKLANLTGLEDVKEKINRQVVLHKFLNLRNGAMLANPSMPLHSLFLGSPGTGKTTVGKILGPLLRQAGSLSKGHVVFRERSTLIGRYYSEEEEKTLAALEEAQGGILFIDEAYQLYQPEDPRDPGKFVLETLMSALADPDKRDWMLVLSGYTKPMLEMLSMNPGLASRIPESNRFLFSDFNSDELFEVASRYLHSNGFELSPEAAYKLTNYIEFDWRHRDESFGNARYVINLIETEIIPAMARRVMAIAEAPVRLPEGFPSEFKLPRSTIVNKSLLQRIEGEDIPSRRCA